MGEAHFQAFVGKYLELFRGVVVFDRQVVHRGLQVLTDGEHADVVAAQVFHHAEDFVHFFAKSDHQPGFGDDRFVARFFVFAQEFQ